MRFKKLHKCVVAMAMVVGMVIPSMGAFAASKFTGTHYVDDLNWLNSSVAEASDGWSNGGMFDCTWRKSNVKFVNGQMQLQINRDYSGYTGAEYRTQQKFGYGMYSVSMKPIKNSGVVSSFFTYTGPSDGTKWDEIDIEFLGYDTTKVQFNYYTSGQGNHEKLYNLGFDASQGFYTYGFFWASNYIAWYVDGKEVYRAYSNIPSEPGKIMCNAWNSTGVDDWLRHYDGRTGITAYYDWFSYDAPKGSTSTSQQTTTNNNYNQNTQPSQNYSSGVSFNANQQYKIINRNSGKALDVSYGSKDDGANILQYSYKGYSNQKWYLKRLDNGTYALQNVGTGKVVSISYGSKDNGANVHQWTNNWANDQQWEIVKDGNYYQFINHNSGKVLDVSGRSTADNANVLQWSNSHGWNQQWSIEPVW